MMNLRKGRAARVAAGLLAAVTCQIALAATITRVVLGERLASTGLFNQGYLRDVVEAHQSGRRDYSVILWTVLMFDAFLAQVLGIDAGDRAAA